jgi:uncharacterized protein HemX
MNLEEFRLEMNAFWEDVEQEAAEQKDSYIAIDRLAALYERFDSAEREMADQVVAEWVLSEDELLRFAARHMIAEFRIVTAVPVLRALQSRLATVDSPGAPYEQGVVNDTIRDLSKKKG